MRIRILSSGFRDLQEGREFHELRRPGPGDYFYDSVFSDIDSLMLYAGIHRKVFGYFRLLLQRFPYAVYYKVSGEDIVVYRVLDCRRDPAIIKSELTKESEQVDSLRDPAP
jgi:plasmid stabilization system protein ParE